MIFYISTVRIKRTHNYTHKKERKKNKKKKKTENHDSKRSSYHMIYDEYLFKTLIAY